MTTDELIKKKYRAQHFMEQVLISGLPMSGQSEWKMHLN